MVFTHDMAKNWEKASGEASPCPKPDQEADDLILEAWSLELTLMSADLIRAISIDF